MSDSQEVKKDNIIIRVLKAIGGKIHQTVDLVIDVSKDIVLKFLSVMKSDAGKFVAEYMDDALRIALEAAKLSRASVKDKVAYFAKEIAKVVKEAGIPDHFINLLREIAVAELKAKGWI